MTASPPAPIQTILTYHVEPLILNPLGEQAAAAFQPSRAAAHVAMAAGGPRASVEAFVAMAAGNTRWQEMIGPAVRERMLAHGETLFGIGTPAATAKVLGWVHFVPAGRAPDGDETGPDRGTPGQCERRKTGK